MAVGMYGLERAGHVVVTTVFQWLVGEKPSNWLRIEVFDLKTNLRFMRGHCEVAYVWLICNGRTCFREGATARSMPNGSALLYIRTNPIDLHGFSGNRAEGSLHHRP